MADNLALPCDRLHGRVLTIDDLLDDVLLEIFDFYVVRYEDLDLREPGDYIIENLRTRKPRMDSWQSLVHVCRRWRGLVFASPRRLNLKICCYTPSISAKNFKRKSLDIWPALPILVLGGVYKESVDDVISILEHRDRISHINLVLHTSSQIEKLWAAMQVPFPELVALYLSFGGFSYGPLLPNSFLGGSAPRLRYFYLHDIPFPGLPNLLLSATHLVNLHLHNIPHSGYISPDAMATCLSMLTSLESLQLEIEFHYPDVFFHPDHRGRRLFPPALFILPALTTFSFKGVNRYLQEFVARIDAPQLSSTKFFGSTTDFDTPELKRFISRTPTPGTYDEAHLIFYGFEVLARLRQTRPEGSDHRIVEVIIDDLAYVRELSTLAKVCTLSLRPHLTMENLYIDGRDSSPLVYRSEIEIGTTRWLDLLLPFTAVKNLYLSRLISPRITLALQELAGARTTEVLPALQNVFLEGFPPSELVRERIARFVSARQLTALTNHSVAVSVWHRDSVDGDD